MQKSWVGIILFLLLITACSPRQVDNAQPQVEEKQEAVVQQGQYTINNFLDKFDAHFRIGLLPEQNQRTERYTYYKDNSGSVWAIKINNQEDYIYTSDDVVKFVQQEMQADKKDFKKKMEEQADREKTDPQVYYMIEDAGFSEHVAVEKTYLTLFMNGPFVMETDLKKWFYFYCSPDIVVKSVAEEREGLSNFRSTGDKAKILADLKSQIPHFTDGIGGYRYDSNSRAMRNVICPPLPADFNKNFKKEKIEGIL